MKFTWFISMIGFVAVFLMMASCAYNLSPNRYFSYEVEVWTSDFVQVDVEYITTNREINHKCVQRGVDNSISLVTGDIFYDLSRGQKYSFIRDSIKEYCKLEDDNFLLNYDMDEKFMTRKAEEEEERYHNMINEIKEFRSK